MESKVVIWMILSISGSTKKTFVMRFSKKEKINKPHHYDQHAKLNNICEDQSNLQTSENTDFGPY